MDGWKGGMGVMTVEGWSEVGRGEMLDAFYKFLVR